MLDLYLLAARCALTLVFFIAGATKLVDQRGARKNLLDFGVPPMFAGPLGLILPAVELAVAAALSFAGSARYGAAGALVLLILFTGAAVANLAQGRRPDCRCFGQVRPKPIGPSTLLRNAFLALIAVALIRQGERVPGLDALAEVSLLMAASWMAVFAIGLALGIVVALEGWYLLQLLQQNGRLMARLEAVEAHLGIASRSSIDAASPQTGLPPGADAPSFSLPDLNGRVHSLDSILQSGEPVLLIFSNPGCPACEALAPAIAEWSASLPSPRIVVISQGPSEFNRRQFGGASPPLVLLQEKMEVEAAYGVQMTPTAVVVDTHGRIAGWLAVGARAVRHLVELSRSGVSQ